MTRVWISICFLAAFSLTFGVIWPDCAAAQSVPQLQRLGQVRDGLRVPARIDVDAAGNLYVADSRNLQIVVFNKYGQQIRTFDVPEMSGNGLAVRPDGRLIYVATRNRVMVLDTTTSVLTGFDAEGEEFASVGFLALDSNNNLYVADVGAGRIRVYDAAGIFQKVLGSLVFNNITSFEIDTQHDGLAVTDEIYVADSLTSGATLPHLYVFNPAGTLLRTHRADGDFGSKQIRIFGGIAFDKAGRFYVADMEQNSLRVMARSDRAAVLGTQLLDFDNENGIQKPKDMVFDALSNRLFVLYGDRQIQIFGVDGGTNPVAEKPDSAASIAVSVPLLIAPVGGSEVATRAPMLQFKSPFTESNAQQISYTVRLFDAGNQLVSSFAVSGKQAVTSAVVPVELEENGLYRWQVQFRAGQESSRWSDLQTFYVNSRQEAPDQPQLLTPLNGVETNTSTVLRWQDSADADPLDSLRYVVEVAADAGFVNPVIRQDVSTVELALVDSRKLLTLGQHYFWRVTAIDNHGLNSASSDLGSFRYMASVLNISANMPGARVYLGGHQNYAGQFVGEAPLELRDLQPGRYQLVVERAGFEPLLQPIEIAPAVVSDVYAELLPALTPTALHFAPLPVAGKLLQGNTAPAPLVVDLDLDGVEDLLLTGADGRIHYYPGVLSDDPAAQGKRQVEFTTEQQLGLPTLPGAALSLVDWNNDFQQDLLVGAADGSVYLYLNLGDFSFAAEGQWLAGVVGQAVPAVADIDQDGDKDLLVGSGIGELVLFSNIGSDSAPQLATQQSLVTFADAAAPSFVDWDADGLRELLVAAEGQLYRATYAAGALGSLTLVETAGVQIAYLNAVNLDAVDGKDLLVGSADGQLLLATAAGKEYVAEFYPALEAKLLQIKTQLTDEQTAQQPLLEVMSARLAERQLDELRDLTEELIFRLPATATAAVTASELAIILHQAPK